MSQLSTTPVIAYDIVGDLHGCVPALLELASRMGYTEELAPPPGRRMVFVGDLADLGSANVLALQLVERAVREGWAFSVLGNHDEALLRRLMGEDAAREAGGDETLTELEAHPDAEALRERIIGLFRSTPLVLELCCGELVIAHAGVTVEMLKLGIDDAARRFILNGEEIGKSPEGRTLRRDWAADYRGFPFIVYGHTPQPKVAIRGRTANLDTGAYRGNALSALRWPEMEIVSTPSGRRGMR